MVPPQTGNAPPTRTTQRLSTYRAPRPICGCFAGNLRLDLDLLRDPDRRAAAKFDHRRKRGIARRLARALRNSRILMRQLIFAKLVDDAFQFAVHAVQLFALSGIMLLDHLFDRVVPGGVVILDDYEWANMYRTQKLAEDPWFDARRYRVTPLPTGQGFVIKR